MSTPETQPPPEPRAKPRGEDMRSKLLEAAIDVFAKHGFDGASTRMLAQAAGANLQAIPYYFGGKEGLYLAVADYVGQRIREHVGPVAARVGARLAAQEPAKGGTPLSPEEAASLLIEMLQAASRLMLSADCAHWARFILSEQMEPTEAFERIYGQVMSPLLGTARQLVGPLLGEKPDSEIVGVRTLALLGQVLIFRVAHAAATRQLGWSEVGPREFALIDDMIRRSVAAIAAQRGAEVKS
jgi:AcrR family transcriptional regulator